MVQAVRKGLVHQIITLYSRAEQKSITEHVETRGGWTTRAEVYIRFHSSVRATETGHVKVNSMNSWTQSQQVLNSINM